MTEGDLHFASGWICKYARIQIVCTIDEQSSYKLILLLSFTMVCRDLRSLSTICKRHPTPNSMNTIAYVNVNKELIINNY